MYPYEVLPFEPSLNKQLMKDFEGERNGFCFIGPKKYVMPLKFSAQAEGIYNMPVRKDDVWVVTLPRSGTTWTQEMVWLINNNLDYDAAAKLPLLARFPFIEFDSLWSKQLLEEIAQLNNNSEAVQEFIAAIERNHYSYLNGIRSPRHLKTHLAFSLLPPTLLDTCKVVYVARNPLDVAVSFYHHNRLLNQHGFSGNFEKFWDYFEKDLLIYMPYWESLFEAWALREHPNMLFLFYEDLIADLPEAIRKVSEFLNKPMSAEQIEKLASHLHIDNFKKSVNLFGGTKLKGLEREGEPGFIRKGKVGDNPEFTVELRARAKKWVEEHLSKTDLKFPRNWRL